MKVLFVSISPMGTMSGHSISLDLLHRFREHGHDVSVVCAQKDGSEEGTVLKEEAGIKVLRVKIGKNKKANPIVKGITTLRLPAQYGKAIKKYYSDVRFDLVLYPTPPVTHAKTVKFIKKRDGAKSYLLLKDIFPQNAVDIGMMTKSGPRGIIYKHFRKEEKKLYALSDYIGCMSQANVDYVLKHNPEVDPAKVEICPNSYEVQDMTVTPEERRAMREKYGLPLDKKIFVYGGNLGKPQGIPFVKKCIAACAKVDEVFFLIVGDGTEYAKLQKFVDEAAPLNLKLMKRLPKEDYDKLVAGCDVGLIFLDHRFTIPNFPSRLLGYMQAGLPVLACTDPNTDVGKVVEEGGFGWWCESNDENRFAEVAAKAASECADPEMKKKELAYLTENFTAEKSYEIVMKHF